MDAGTRSHVAYEKACNLLQTHELQIPGNDGTLFSRAPPTPARTENVEECGMAEERVKPGTARGPTG